VTSVAGQTGTVTSAELATALDADGTRLSDASLRAAFDARYAPIGSGGGVTVTDNGDGTFTASGTAVTDNGDGTFTIAA
jgi:hypothetical protein